MTAARLAAMLGQTTLAETLARRALRISRAFLCDVHLVRADIDVALAEIHMARGSWGAAHAALHQALHVRRAVLGPTHADVLEVLALLERAGAAEPAIEDPAVPLLEVA